MAVEKFLNSFLVVKEEQKTMFQLHSTKTHVFYPIK